MNTSTPRTIRNPWKRLIPLALVLLATLWLNACGSEASCTDDYDCPNTGEICVQGSCEGFTCAVDTDCNDPTNICINNKCKSPQ
jgi:hypothetical protein